MVNKGVSVFKQRQAVLALNINDQITYLFINRNKNLRFTGSDSVSALTLYVAADKNSNESRPIYILLCGLPPIEYFSISIRHIFIIFKLYCN